MTVIVDVSRLASARFCARLAAVAGDEVVRFEPLAARHPTTASIDRAELRDAYLSDHIAVAEVDWSDPNARREVERAIERADVVISSFANGAFDSPYDDDGIRARNPNAVHLVVSPFGLDGAYREDAASSLTDWAASGYLYITGEPERPPLAGPPDMCAYATGYVAAIAMESALAAVRAGGPAVTLDVSHMEAMLSLHNVAFPRWAAGDLMSRIGHVVGPATYPHGSYPCRDGDLFLGIVTDEEWDRFVIAIDRPELCSDPVFATGPARIANAALTDQIVTAWTIDRDVREAAFSLQAARVPAVECATPRDLLDDPQLASRDYLRDVALAERDVVARFPGNVLLAHPAKDVSGEPTSRRVASRHREDPNGEGPVLPLTGVTVIDLSVWWAGPMAARILGDLGANVIRVERPTVPVSDADVPMFSRFLAQSLQRNKRSIVVDLQTPQGVDIVQRLIGRADVLIQNYRPGALDQLGVGPASALAANPRLVYVSLSGYGSEGPKAGWGTYGTLSEAASGVRTLTHYPGERGMRLGEQLPDGICGMAGVLAALRALRERDRTGAGCFADISQLEAYVSLIGEEVGAASLQAAGLDVRADTAAAGFDVVLPCRGEDEWVAVSLTDAPALDALFASLDDDGDDTPADTPAGRLAAYAAARTKYDVAASLQSLSVAAFPVVSTRDLVSDPNLDARGFFVDASIGDARGTLPGSPIRSSQRALTAFRRPAPVAGQHSTEILREELQLSEDEIERLLGAAVVRQHREEPVAVAFDARRH